MRRIFAFAMAFILGGRLLAQETGAGAPYLIPQTVFVGDRGRLVVPLGPAFAEARAFVVEGPEKLPGSKDLVIYRLELERRGGTSRLLIDFAAYAPGRLPLPPVELQRGPAASSGEGDLQVSGLEVSIASILSPGSMILAEPAPPLAVPGTTFLIYGTLGLIVLILFMAAGIGFGGRRRLGRLWGWFRRRCLLRSMERSLRRLRAEALRGTGEGEILARFSGEMREFLSFFTGTDCRTWTSGEFFRLSPEVSAIFRRSDTLRFSGTGIDREELFAILDDARLFIKMLGDAEKVKKPEASSGAEEVLLQLNTGGWA